MSTAKTVLDDTPMSRSPATASGAERDPYEPGKVQAGVRTSGMVFR
jgi:hypothetical protein